MKKLILTAAALSTILCVSAQRQYSPNLAIGGKAGMTMSRMSFAPEVKQNFQNGMMAGITVRYTEENHFGLIGELNIEQRGWKENFEENAEFSYSRTLTYLQIPLLTHIYFGGKKFKGFVNLGPEFGYMISSSISANFDYRNISAVPDFPQGYRTNEQIRLRNLSRPRNGIHNEAQTFLYARGQILLRTWQYFPLCEKRLFFRIARDVDRNHAWVYVQGKMNV